MKNKVKNYLLYGGVNKDDYALIKPLLWKRNVKAVHITTCLAAAMGLIFLIVNLISKSGLYFPYIFLLAGSVFTFFILLSIHKLNFKRNIFAVIICYFEVLLICTYAGILSTREANIDVPATSIIVFIAVLPLAIDDRPIRMFSMMIFESLGYLLVSKYLKTPHAFYLDIMNVATFCVVGMVLYGIICSRNIREIYQSVRIEKIQQGVITSLATVVEERDESTGNHIQRTSYYVEKIVEQMKKDSKYNYLTEEYYKNLILSAPMHDIGKIKIPDQILNKPGRLTEEEFEIMKKHTEYGGRIILQTINNVEEKEYCDIAYNVACYHHENYNGSGYPKGLKGEEIPLEARIMALADVYDALISERCYKKPINKKDAIKIIKDGSGVKFDPRLAEMFLNSINKD